MITIGPSPTLCFPVSVSADLILIIKCPATGALTHRQLFRDGNKLFYLHTFGISQCLRERWMLPDPRHQGIALMQVAY